MCTTCGCGSEKNYSIKKVDGQHHHDLDEEQHRHMHEHGIQHEHHDHSHEYDGHHHGQRRVVPLQQSVLEKNNLIAERNRGFFKAKGIRVINLLSSPGSGKTTLLEKTLQALKNKAGMSVIVGDPQTDLDAIRLGKKDAPVIQVITGDACHLDAEMIWNSIQQIEWNGKNLLFIENVGNLVCPAAYDLGENSRVVLLSLTEGEDKPLKYPTIFKTAEVVLLTKLDLKTAGVADVQKMIENVRAVAPQAKIISVSARNNDGLEEWYNWLQHPADE